MTKFSLKCEHDSDYVVTAEFDKEHIDEVVDAIDSFLRGCGYFFDDLVITKKQPSSIKDELKHSAYYYDFDRNR